MLIQPSSEVQHRQACGTPVRQQADNDPSEAGECVLLVLLGWKFKNPQANYEPLSPDIRTFLRINIGQFV